MSNDADDACEILGAALNLQLITNRIHYSRVRTKPPSGKGPTFTINSNDAGVGSHGVHKTPGRSTVENILWEF